MKAIENIRAKLPFPGKASLSADETQKLETALQSTLLPVAPRQEFVERLNRQLIRSAPLARSQPASMMKGLKTRENLLIGAASLLGAAAIFATGFRVAITLLGAIGIILQWTNRKSSEEQSPLGNGV